MEIEKKTFASESVIRQTKIHQMEIRLNIS